MAHFLNDLEVAKIVQWYVHLWKIVMWVNLTVIFCLFFVNLRPFH